MEADQLYLNVIIIINHLRLVSRFHVSMHTPFTIPLCVAGSSILHIAGYGYAAISVSIPRSISLDQDVDKKYQVPGVAVFLRLLTFPLPCSVPSRPPSHQPLQANAFSSPSLRQRQRSMVSGYITNSGFIDPGHKLHYTSAQRLPQG